MLKYNHQTCMAFWLCGFNHFLVSGVRKFGKNFATIASILGTKTESHVRSFFVNYKRRYNLDVAYKEYEAEFGPTDSGENDENDKDDTNGVDEHASKSSLPNSPRSKSPATTKVNGSKWNEISNAIWWFLFKKMWKLNWWIWSVCLNFCKCLVQTGIVF